MLFKQEVEFLPPAIIILLLVLAEKGLYLAENKAGELEETKDEADFNIKNKSKNTW